MRGLGCDGCKDCYIMMDRHDDSTLQLIASQTEQCEKCGLYSACSNPFMLPDTVDGTVSGLIMYIGEAPGEDEDRLGRPFVGRSGQMLRDVIREAGLQHYDAVFTNVCRCHPPGNKTPAKRQSGYCTPILLSEIEAYKPDLIILLGNVPLDAVLGESGITKWRGTLIERDGHAYLPIFHPAYILRNQAVLRQWLGDFETAFNYMEGNIGNVDVSDDYDVTIVTTEAQALDMFFDITRAGRCAWDTELTGLNPYAGKELIMMSFAIVGKRAWAVVLNDETLPVCDTILKLDTVEKIGHNVKYDMLAVRARRGYWVENVVGDSMLVSYLLDPTPGRHGLKPLAGRHLGMYDYDREVSEYLDNYPEADPSGSGDFSKVPQDILARYAAKDAIATLELHDLLYEQLPEEMRTLYHALIIPASSALAEMESNGVLVDQDVVHRYLDEYGAERDLMEQKIKADPHVMAYVADRKEEDPKYEFNPNSTYQIGDVLFGEKYCAVAPVAFTATGRPSVAWDNLVSLVGEVPVLEPYRLYKLVRKMLSTYIEPASGEWLDDDGRVRSSYLLHGTRTGRLASRDPNLQNIPTPEKEPGTILENLPIKSIFVHSFPDGCLMNVDYSGMELRTMASVAGCQGMVDAFKRGEDIHSMVTEHLYGVKRKDFSEHDWKAMRYKGKWMNWTLLFGGDWHTLHRIYGVEEAESQQLVSMYYDLFPEILEYKEHTLAFARKHGYVVSPFGRKRVLPYINDNDFGYRSKAERAALNMPIQSAASDMLLAALIILVDAMRDNGLKSLVANTVHDSIMFDVYPGELDDLAWLCVEVMENVPTKYAKEWFPGIDFSWFTVPLVADVEVGSHYGTVKKYEVER